MREVRVIRAIKLLQGLRVGPRFDMVEWGQGDLKENLAQLTEDDLHTGCGTSACALGWIASTEAARAEGLRLVRPQPWIAYRVEYLPYKANRPLEGAMAAWHYFGFEFEETVMRLFLPISYELQRGYKAITPAMVATRMQAVLDVGEAAFLKS